MIVLSVILFYVMFSIYSDINKIAYNFSKIDVPLLLLIFLSSFCVLLAKGIRQFLLLKYLGIEIGIKENFMIFFSGLPMLVTPAGIGEIIKSYYLKKRNGENISKTFPFVLMEKSHDLLAMITIISIILFFVDLEAAKILSIISWMIFIAAFSIFRNKKLFYRIIPKIGKVKKLHKFSDNLSSSYESLHSLLGYKIMVKSWITSMVSWILTAISYYLCFKALHINMDMLHSTLFTLTSIVFGAISFLPGGVGVVELSLAQLLIKTGLDLGIASSLVLLVRLTGTWFAVAIGFIASRSVMKIQSTI